MYYLKKDKKTLEKYKDTLHNAKKYILIEEDHINKKISVISESPIKYNVLYEMESICEQILLAKNGYDDNLKYFKQNEHKRPYSYYIEKCDKLDGLNIVNKYIDRGYIYNSVIHEKIKSFYVFELYFKSYIYKDPIDKIMLFNETDKYNSLMDELQCVYEPSDINNLVVL